MKRPPYSVTSMKTASEKKMSSMMENIMISSQFRREKNFDYLIKKYEREAVLCKSNIVDIRTFKVVVDNGGACPELPFGSYAQNFSPPAKEEKKMVRDVMKLIQKSSTSKFPQKTGIYKKLQRTTTTTITRILPTRSAKEKNCLLRNNDFSNSNISTVSTNDSSLSSSELSKDSCILDGHQASSSENCHVHLTSAVECNNGICCNTFISGHITRSTSLRLQQKQASAQQNMFALKGVHSEDKKLKEKNDMKSLSKHPFLENKTLRVTLEKLDINNLSSQNSKDDDLEVTVNEALHAVRKSQVNKQKDRMSSVSKGCFLKLSSGVPCYSRRAFYLKRLVKCSMWIHKDKKKINAKHRRDTGSASLGPEIKRENKTVCAENSALTQYETENHKTMLKTEVQDLSSTNVQSQCQLSNDVVSTSSQVVINISKPVCNDFINRSVGSDGNNSSPTRESVSHELASSSTENNAVSHSSPNTNSNSCETVSYQSKTLEENYDFKIVRPLCKSAIKFIDKINFFPVKPVNTDPLANELKSNFPFGEIENSNFSADRAMNSDFQDDDAVNFDFLIRKSVHSTGKNFIPVDKEHIFMTPKKCNFMVSYSQQSGANRYPHKNGIIISPDMGETNGISLDKPSNQNHLPCDKPTNLEEVNFSLLDVTYVETKTPCKKSDFRVQNTGRFPLSNTKYSTEMDQINFISHDKQRNSDFSAHKAVNSTGLNFIPVGEVCEAKASAKKSGSKMADSCYYSKKGFPRSSSNAAVKVNEVSLNPVTEPVELAFNCDKLVNFDKEKFLSTDVKCKVKAPLKKFDFQMATSQHMDASGFLCSNENINIEIDEINVISTDKKSYDLQTHNSVNSALLNFTPTSETWKTTSVEFDFRMTNFQSSAKHRCPTRKSSATTEMDKINFIGIDVPENSYLKHTFKDSARKSDLHTQLSLPPMASLKNIFKDGNSENNLHRQLSHQSIISAQECVMNNTHSKSLPHPAKPKSSKANRFSPEIQNYRSRLRSKSDHLERTTTKSPFHRNIYFRTEMDGINFV